MLLIAFLDILSGEVLKSENGHVPLFPAPYHLSERRCPFGRWKLVATDFGTTWRWWPSAHSLCNSIVGVICITWLWWGNYCTTSLKPHCAPIQETPSCQVGKRFSPILILGACLVSPILDTFLVKSSICIWFCNVLQDKEGDSLYLGIEFLWRHADSDKTPGHS